MASRAAERIFIWGGQRTKKGTVMSKRALTVHMRIIITNAFRPYLTGGDVAAATATDQSRRLGRLGRPKIACALTKAETSAATAPCLYIPRSTTRSIIRWCQHTLSHVITKVGQTASSSVAEKSLQRLLSLQQVSETSRRRRGDVSSVSSRSRRRRGDVAGTSPQSRVKLVSATNGDVSATCWRLKEVSVKIEHVWFFRDSPETRLVSRRRRGDVAETSPRLAETRVAN